MKQRFAILMDGGFCRKVVGRKLKKFPTSEDILSECKRIQSTPCLQEYELLRVYWYDAPPAAKKITNPISGEITNLTDSPHYKDAVKLHSDLLSSPNVALRMGDALVRGWSVGEKAIRDFTRNGVREITADDLIPNINQKGVDLRIGLDISRLSLRQYVEAIVVVTGDADLTPAFKFARREGVRIYLDHLSSNVRDELKQHADILVSPEPEKRKRKKV